MLGRRSRKSSMRISTRMGSRCEEGLREVDVCWDGSLGV
jgi:hypothetical protein